MDLALDHQEDVGAGAFRHLAAIVQHERVGIARPLRLVLRQRADHVEAGRLRVGRRGFRRGPLPFRPAEPDALLEQLRREIGRPLPDRDGEVNLVLLRRHAHHLAAAPRHRADIGVLQLHRLQDLQAGGIDLRDAVGDLEAEDLGGLHQPLVMLGHLEDLPLIGALAFEHAGGIVQAVGQDMDPGVAPRHELAVEPDRSVAVVERQHAHARSLFPRGRHSAAAARGRR